ncbi:dal80p-controlled protein [Cladophialophora chaetospira]|uniref:Dal80p-controlled protein n=1 Tax=Cladophialophora chaetospira TaxID=386627 RepID=A0AA38WW76_9EURO|nr:dal80p-controlled protein [Cladophialophora chaetospira]
MTTPESTTPVRILIINPNTSQHMTDALQPVVDSLGFPSVQYTFFTSPSPGIPSINSPADAAESAKICLPHLIPLLAHHDGFLVACYSQHPLVSRLKNECAKLKREATVGGGGVRKYVTGIFEASVLASLALIDADTTDVEEVAAGEGEGTGSPGSTFGIVSTGKVWEEALRLAVEDFIGVPTTTRSRFVGCETTGLNASELHDLDPEEVRAKMMDATKRLLKRGTTRAQSSRVQAICLGCAGMVGLDEAVRTACVEVLGEERGKGVYIVDGVKAGVGQLYGLARGGF